MANIKSVIKDIRRTKKKTVYNNRLENRMKRAEKSFDKVLATDNVEDKKKALAHIQKVMDKAAQKGYIKKNTASRKKARLAVKLTKATAVHAKANTKHS